MSGEAPERQLEIFREGVATLVSESELLERLRGGRPLRIKYGCDPSAPDLHLGHVVVLTKLRQLQELGHTIIFLVGDFTAMIGDPTGRSRTRPPLPRETIVRNAETYTEQVGAVLDTERVELRYNSEWMGEMDAKDLIRLASHYTVARMIERDDFQKRYHSGTPIAVHEFLYPLVQAYDSVELDADMEVGGTDQTFNLLLGREIQRAYGKTPQIVLTLPLLEGTDGVEKMSKSLGNAIGIREPAEEIYGRTMSIPDSLVPLWIERLAPDDAELADLQRRTAAGGNPRDLKAALAWKLVERFHGADAARAAEVHFDRLFRRHRPPEDLKEIEVTGEGAGGAELITVLRAAGFARSGAEARRLIQQGGVRLDDVRIEEVDLRVPPGAHLLQAGKRRFARVRVVAGKA
ncbi:MAG: tyrosine--tRNA ligase [Myxococcota bacterium]